MEGHSAMIFVNGELRVLQAVKALLPDYDLWIAADGGLRHTYNLGIVPHVLIGDLDSVTTEQVTQQRRLGVEILQYPKEKDETDLELALDLALQRGCRRILLVGALGGRLDHTLGNLFLLNRPELAGVDVRLCDGQEAVWLVGRHTLIDGDVGEQVSLIPFSDEVNGVRTAGMKYPLKSETIYRWSTRGISNELLNQQAEVWTDAGTLLCIHSLNAKRSE
jgi:thiamine pyrophosphokinase